VQQQHAAELQSIASQHAKDKVALEGRIRRLEVHNEQLIEQVPRTLAPSATLPCISFTDITNQRDKLMKERDTSISDRGNFHGRDDRGLGHVESGHAKRGELGSSSFSAAAASATAQAATAAQQHTRGLEEKVADLEAKLEQALSERDRLFKKHHKTQ
jgi:hypothetical protein